MILRIPPVKTTITGRKARIRPAPLFMAVSPRLDLALSYPRFSYVGLRDLGTAPAYTISSRSLSQRTWRFCLYDSTLISSVAASMKASSSLQRVGLRVRTASKKSSICVG